MPYLSNYKMEFMQQKSALLYYLCTYGAPICRGLCLIMIIPAIIVSPWFTFGVVVPFLLSFLLGFLGNRTRYTIKFEYNNGFFLVKKFTLDGKEYKLEKIDCNDVNSISIVKESACEKRYIFEGDNLFIVEINYGNTLVAVSLDNYMYSVICAAAEG